MDEVAVDMVSLLAASRDEHGVVHDLNDVLFRWSMECESIFQDYFEVISLWLYYFQRDVCI